MLSLLGGRWPHTIGVAHGTPVEAVSGSAGQLPGRGAVGACATVRHERRTAPAASLRPGPGRGRSGVPSAGPGCGGRQPGRSWRRRSPGPRSRPRGPAGVRGTISPSTVASTLLRFRSPWQNVAASGRSTNVVSASARCWPDGATLEVGTSAGAVVSRAASHRCSGGSPQSGAVSCSRAIIATTAGWWDYRPGCGGSGVPPRGRAGPGRGRGHAGKRRTRPGHGAAPAHGPVGRPASGRPGRPASGRPGRQRPTAAWRTAGAPAVPAAPGDCRGGGVRHRQVSRDEELPWATNAGT